MGEKYQIIAPRSFELDLIDTECVDNYFENNRFDVVLHAGVKPGHRNAKDSTNLFYSNVRMFANLERHKDKFKKFINFGSGAIYDVSANNSNVKEYEIFKRLGKDDHSFCKYIEHKLIENLDGFVDLNIFGIFGRYEDYEIRFISNAICKAINGLPITLRQNRRFSYLYIDDLMPILEHFIENDAKYKSYNIVPSKNVELLEIAKIVREISQKDIEIKVANDGYGLDYTGDNSRLLEEIPNCHFTDIKDSIKRLYDYYVKNNNHMINKNLLLVDK